MPPAVPDRHTGQRADCTQFKQVLDKIRVPEIGPGMPRKKPDRFAADKAYSNRSSALFAGPGRAGAADNPQFTAVADKINALGPAGRPPRTRLGAVAADTAYSDRDTCAQVRHGAPAPIQRTRESGATGSRCDEGHVLPTDNRTRGSGNVGDADSRVHIPFPLTHGVQRWPTPVSAKLSKLWSSSPNPVSNRTRCSTVSTRLPHAPQRRRSARPGRVRGDGRRHPNAGHGGDGNRARRAERRLLLRRTTRLSDHPDRWLHPAPGLRR